MTEVVSEPVKTPGIVIFVSVLSFISAGVSFLFAVLCIAALSFGNFIGIYNFLTRQINQYYQTNANASMGFNVLFTTALFFCVFFLVLFALVGVGLLKGKKLAWFFQIALSILGLMGVPFGTILNAIILIFFFQRSVRDYFKV